MAGPPAAGRPVPPVPPSPKGVPKAARFAELDALRGLAALTVVIYHYTWRFDALYGLDATIPGVIRLGKYGPHFFFIISGFVICWSLSKAVGVRGFLVSRASRIYPAYWTALCLTFATVALAGLPGREAGIGTALVNLTMIQEYLLVPHVDGAYWTLTVELTFYFWIVLFQLAGQLHRAELLFVPLMLLGVAVNLDLVHLPSRVALLMLVDHANQFAAGIVLLRMYDGTATRAAPWLLALSALVNFAAYPWPDALFLSAFLPVFVLAVSGRLRGLCVPPLLWLGGVSYSLYLVHQNIGYVLMRAVIERTGSELAAVGVALLVALVIADALARLVERPATRALRALASRR